MPQNKTPTSLKTELSRLAKLSIIQIGLPPLLRSAPVLAILAGEVIARATNGRNSIEERILGPDETFLLKEPSRQTPLTTTVRETEGFRQGVGMMCRTCGQGKTRFYSYMHTDGWRKYGSPGCYRVLGGKDNSDAGQWIVLMRTNVAPFPQAASQ
ncbi:hypothetical protein TOPH_06145 [Tolypocladium ophioglossoides CBS 100239]|uniref:Uncharacterized protein n=1 Tax=Tolypocladium ophioglossoides (strain CBS 100239) TaxID=1163406 RepID=A0A0L0N5T9_TOLOC|nr:hypothetical protein TOPH_06145 [Tolypocladium ophioglossoides CBS 100239]